MAERDEEWEKVYDREAHEGKIRIRAYIERHTGSRDQVVVHTYASAEESIEDTEHNIWRFWLIDEEDQLAKYKTTRGEAEPSQLALWGLKDYGYDCTNFDIDDEDDFAASESESFAQLGREALRRAGTLEDPAREDLMVEIFIRAELYAKLTDPDGAGSDMLAAIYGEREGSGVDELEVTIPEFVPVEERAGLSNAMVERFRELVEEYSETDWMMSDQREVR